MTTPKLLILSFTETRRDPRVYRQVKLFKDRYAVTTIGLGDSPFPDVEHVRLRHLKADAFGAKLLRRLSFLYAGEDVYSRQYTPENANAYASLRPDLVLVNDAEPLPLAFDLAGDAPVVFDAHEYYPGQDASLRWILAHRRRMTALCRRYMPRCAAVMTVAKGIADEYARRFAVKPELILNAPPYAELRPADPQGNLVRLIHHGGAVANRHLESLIEMMDHLDERFQLDLMLVPTNPDYYGKLQRMAASRPRVRFRDPVAMPDIPRTINEYDLGVYPLAPTSFNQAHALPNKFFEFIQARLGVAIGPSPEMARLVREHNLGIVATGFTPRAMAEALDSVRADDITQYKANAHKVAKQYCAEVELENLGSIVSRFLR